MDSSDDEKSKGSDSPNDNGSSILKEEDKPGRILLRPWLESVLEMGNIEGLQWIDADKTMFKVPWKHRSKKDWSTRHSSVFLEWAKNTGRWTKGDPTPNYAQLKTRLRCAFNKAPDIEEMKGHHFQQGEEPYKVYRFKSKKECWTMKQNNLVARNAAKHNKIHFFGRSNNNSNASIQWGIKKERFEEEPHMEEQEANYYSNGNGEQKVLSFKEHMEDLKGDIRLDSEVADTNGQSTEQRESKFIPSVIPLCVELFSSFVSDESDAENEGSRRSRGRGRPSYSKSQKQQDPDQQTPQQLPLKQQNDFASNPPHIPTSTTHHNNTANGKLNDDRGNLDFLQVASLFVEASEILQNGKDAVLKSQSETSRSIKQEVPEPVDSEGEADRSEESNIKESGKEKHIIIKSLESSAIPNTVPKLSSPPTNYPPNLPKLDLHPSLRSCNMLSMDPKVGNQIFQQLSKIRLNSNNVSHQVGISTPKLRFPPPPGISLSQVVTPLTISRSNPNAPSRFLIFSTPSFLSNLSSPVFSVARPCNPENLKIVLGKIQTPPVLKDSGFASKSIPSLIMLSSAAEVAESTTVQQNATSNISLNRVPGATVSIENVVPSLDIGTAIAETKSNESQNAIGSQDMIVIAAVDKSDDNEVIMEKDIEEPESVAMETVATGEGEVLLSSSSDSQDEALDLSSAATKHSEPQSIVSIKEQSMEEDDLSDKLEIDETSLNSNVKEDVSGCKKFVVDDDDGIDVVSHLNEAGSTLREVEESISADPKLLRSLRNVLDMLKMCTAELNQKQKSLKSQQDILHLRTRLLESEEEKMQLKVQYFGISRKKEDSSLIDTRHEYYGSVDNRALFVRDGARDGRSSASIFPILADKTSEHTAVMVNKSGAPYNACLPQRTVLNFSPSNSIKVTVAPSQPVIPLTLTSTSKSPKPIRVINLGKPPEPCGMGVVHPMQQVQQPRPTTTPAFSYANGIRASCAPRSMDLAGVSPSLSPSSSPIVLNIQNPYTNMKVVKINRTPSTENMASSSFPVATALCPPTLLTSSAKSKSPETKIDDEVIAIKNPDPRDVSSTNQKCKQRDGVASEEEEEWTTAKRFKFDEKEENQTLKCYEEFKIKNKYSNSNHHQ